MLQGGVTNEPSVCWVDLEPRAERRRAKPYFAAAVLDVSVADLTEHTALDSDDLDLVLTELSLSGIEVERDRIKTVGDLIERLRRPRPCNVRQ